MPAIAILKASCNPAGRINRKGFLYLALIILTLQIALYGLIWGLGLNAGTPLLRLFDFATLWICLTAAAKRLHDTGRSSIWILYAVALSLAFSVLVFVVALLSLGQPVLQPNNPFYVWILALNTLPALAITLWLHCTRGEDRSNRFGPPPDHTGFSAPSADPQLTPVLDQ